MQPRAQKVVEESSLDAEKIPEFRLTSKTSGKSSGRKDSNWLATQIAALEMIEQDRGEGLPNLLIPVLKQNRGVLEETRKTNEVRTVIPRDTSRRKAMQKAIIDRALIENLACLYLAAINFEERRCQIRLLADWIANQVRSRQGEAHHLIVKTHPDLEDRTQASWWARQIALHRKAMTTTSSTPE